MSDNKPKGATMAKDTIIYMLAKGIEGIIGIVTLSVMSYLFTTAQTGRYSTINIAITTIAMVAIQWLVQSVLRYINKYDIANKHKEFYSTVFTAWFWINTVVPVLGFILLFVLKFAFGKYAVVEEFTAVYSYSSFLFGILWFVTYNTAQLMIAMLAAIRQAKLNLVLSMITVFGKLLFMVIFCKLWGSRIEWIFLSYFITDGIVALIGMKKLNILYYIKSRQFSGDILKELKEYGMPLMGNMLSTSVLNKSDIYIITAILGASASGIYQMNYTLVATAFTLLNASVMRGCYPTILRAWSEGNKDAAKWYLNSAVRMYLMVAVPAVVGVASVSQVVASTLFEEGYSKGHTVMFWVALGMMFLGLTEYSIKHWELNANTKAIFGRSLIGGVVNVALNIILIKVTGSYYIASVTTFVGFFVYFILARFGTRHYLSWSLKPITLVRILGSSVVMAVVIYALKQILPSGKIYLAIYIICGIIVYGVSLVITGEVKDELNAVLNKAKGIKNTNNINKK